MSPTKTRIRLALRDGNRCWLCGEEFDDVLRATLDHVTPRALGGKNGSRNLRLAHKLCNQVRGHLEEDIAPRAVRALFDYALGRRNAKRAQQFLVPLRSVHEHPTWQIKFADVKLVVNRLRALDSALLPPRA